MAGRDITHAACLAHCRRKFWEAFKASKRAKNSFAIQGLDQIKAIYKVEAETKGMDSEQRLEHRREKMLPLFKQLKTWLDESINQVPATLKTGEAMRYLSDQWPKLQHVFEDGRIPLDNNFVEGRIRPFTLGRKNWMFSDTPAGARSSAMIYSIIETARANGLEPYAYLCHIISELPSANSVDEVEALLPHNYKKQTLH